MIGQKKAILIIISLAMLSWSCNNSNKKAVNDDIESKLKVELDTSSTIVKFENTVFSLPSPYQLSLLIKELGVTYNVEYLNPTTNINRYNSLFKKAINLGVYGSDLAYLNIYEQSPSAITYFSVVKILAQDLGLTAAFDANLFDRIENNFENKDSLLYIISNTYRDIDLFLKQSQRQREGVLVLAGGWVEATYFMSKLAVETKNQKLLQRVGENKQPLENLIKLLSPYYRESDDMKKLVDDLIDLSYEFDGIETEYTYIDPETIIEERKTIIKSKSKVNVTEEVLLNIEKKVEDLRNYLID